MIINPFPMMGWNGTFKGPFNYVAMAIDAVQQSGVVVSHLHYRASVDAEKWSAAALSGDLKNEMRSNDEGGAFIPSAMLEHQGVLFAAGNLITGSGSQSAIYATRNGWSWQRMDIPSSEGDNSAALTSMAAHGTHVFAIGGSGALYYTDDLGDTWARRDDLPIGGPQPRHVNGVAASEGGILVYGRMTNTNGTPGASLLLHATSPAGTFSPVSHPSSPGIDNIVAGNVMLAARARTPAQNTNRLMWSELDDLTTWTQADLSTDQFVDLMFYGNDRWLAGTGYNKVWFSSPSASQEPGKAGWYVPSEKPWEESYPGSHPEIWTGLFTGEKFVLQVGGNSISNPGRLAVSADGLEWGRKTLAEAGLAEKRYVFAARP